MATLVAIAITVVLGIVGLGGYLPPPSRARSDSHPLMRGRPRRGNQVLAVAALFAALIALAIALHFVAP